MNIFDMILSLDIYIDYWKCMVYLCMGEVIVFVIKWMF